VYFPVIYAPIQFFLGYQGVPVGVEPDYVTEGSGCECVDFDGVAFLTLQYASIAYAGTPCYIFLRSLPTGAFRMGPIGAQVTTVTATLPIESSGGSNPNISLEIPLPILYGGTGTETPNLVAGSGIVITGTPFNWTISVSSTGFVQSVSGQSPIASSGGPNPVISLTTVPVDLGGTGQTNPQLNAGAGINVTGNIFQPSGNGAWTVINTGVLGAIAQKNAGETLTGDVGFTSSDGSVSISANTSGGANAVDFSVVTGATVAVVTELNPTMINGAGETVTLPTLGMGQWFVEVIVHGFGLPQTSSDSITLTGAGWGGLTIEDNISGNQFTRTLYQAGVVGAGNNPSVTITGTGVTLNSGSGYISCSIKAIRIS
jgi:hypothetical protein